MFFKKRKTNASASFSLHCSRQKHRNNQPTMNRGRSRSPTTGDDSSIPPRGRGRPPHPSRYSHGDDHSHSHRPIVGDGSCPDESFSRGTRLHGRGRGVSPNSRGSSAGYSYRRSISNYAYVPKKTSIEGVSHSGRIPLDHYASSLGHLENCESSAASSSVSQNGSVLATVLSSQCKQTSEEENEIRQVLQEGRGRRLSPNMWGSSAGFSYHGSISSYAYVPKKPSKDEVTHSQRMPFNRDASESHLKQCESSAASNLVYQSDSVLATISSSQSTQTCEARTKIGQVLQEGAVEETSRLDHAFEAQNVTNKYLCKKSTFMSDSGISEGVEVIEPFDICPPKRVPAFFLKRSLLDKNRERRNAMKCLMEGENGQVLRKGMVLLKHYLSLHDQAAIIRLSRNLGLGPGGFYVPGYRDGATLRLKMMCLGINWDPDTRSYGDFRPFDGAKPPGIPLELSQFVLKAIKDSQALIQRNSLTKRIEDVLPSMSPNICIVNFYPKSGRLGLHQDKDESQESLHKGLPVVSFSIGDTGEFLYGEQRDIDKAEKILLESGDVLVFGGKSRLIFHGITSVLPDTAPQCLLEETGLGPGRLNLTFRQY